MNDFDEVQLEKINNFREDGIEPYPHGDSIKLNQQPSDILMNMDAGSTLSITELSTIETTCAGRILFKNEIGNVGFARISYGGKILQIFVSKKEVGADTFKLLWKKLDVGDMIMVRGPFMRTRMGELTLRVQILQLTSKCIKGMPDKVSGITDFETMQRQRYLDLMVNPKSYERFMTRTKIINYIRNALISYGFIEVETPILQAIPGGASAKPFVTHHNALDSELFMRVAPELYLKRLIVGGFPRVFEIGKNFRNEGISSKHNPEFTMVEFYSSYSTYEYLMELTKRIIRRIVRMVYNNNDFKLEYGEHIIDYDNWTTVSFIDALSNYVEDPWSLDSLRTFINENTGIRIEDIPDDITKLWDIVFDQFVEPTLINPTFITHYPVQISPLARRNDNDPRVTDRFELFIGTYEVANGFNELNDPVEQAERFAEQARRKSNGDDEAMYFDEDYINALSYGMPPTAGEGIGIDRLVMLLTNSQNIRDIILFPTKNRK